MRSGCCWVCRRELLGVVCLTVSVPEDVEKGFRQALEGLFCGCSSHDRLFAMYARYVSNGVMDAPVEPGVLRVQDHVVREGPRGVWFACHRKSRRGVDVCWSAVRPGRCGSCPCGMVIWDGR